MLLGVGGCAHEAERIGEKTTAGALEAVQKESSDGRLPEVEEATRSAVQGALEGGLQTLASEDQQAHLRRIAHTLVSEAMLTATGAPWSQSPLPHDGTAAHAAHGRLTRMTEELGRAFTHAVTSELGRELGPEGDGPLARSLASTVERAAASGLSRVERRTGPGLHALLASCESAPDFDRCLEQRVAHLSRTASSGVAEGIQRSFAVWGFALAFGAGLVLGLLMTLIVLTLRLHRRLPPPGTPRFSPAPTVRRPLAGG